MGRERHLNAAGGQKVFYMARNFDMNHPCVPYCNKAINKKK